MILYQLRCGHGHDFEAWFRDSAGYDVQAESGDVSCPFCGTTKVAKAPMAPNIASRPADGATPDGAEARANEVAEKILEAVDGLRAHVEEEYDDVGEDFADEARRIHYGDAEERGIFGEATDEEADDLDDEGVPYFRLPFVRRRGR